MFRVNKRDALEKHIGPDHNKRVQLYEEQLAKEEQLEANKAFTISDRLADMADKEAAAKVPQLAMVFHLLS